MQTIRLRANAKLNLALDVTGRREDGYHLMDMVMQSVDLYDLVELSVGGDFPGIRVQTGARFVPSDRRNTAYRAAELLAERAGFAPDGISISIKKNIPTRAGLGGGSADAAAVLVGLERLLDLGIPPRELARIGEGVGADVPFCVLGGTARVTGIGELVQPIDPLKKGRFVILMPRVGNSTRELFSLLDRGEGLEHPEVEACQRAISRGDLPALGESLGNLFQQVGDPAETRRLRLLLLENGALGACLTGSGAAVYGLFRDQGSASRCRDRVRRQVARAFVVSPVSRGVQPE